MKPGDAVQVPDGRIGILINFRLETDRAVVQFAADDRLLMEPFKYSELKPEPPKCKSSTN
jgi:hypothetical protein